MKLSNIQIFHNIKLLLSATLLLVVLFFPSKNINAQQSTGGINGHIVDETGAIIAGADILLINCETGVIVKTKSTFDTKDNGAYKIETLPPGDYVLRVSASGFLLRTEGVIHVSDNKVEVVDIKLVTPPNPSPAQVGGSEFEIIPGYIRGRIENHMGSPVKMAIISIVNQVNNNRRAELTDDNGTYNFFDVETGNYELKVYAVGYEELTQRNIIIDHSGSVNSYTLKEQHQRDN
jgi:uncharacterized surface anchored protein